MEDRRPEGFQVTDSPPDRLDSWKAIAVFLGVDIRTARRYEEQRGLPVHRLPGDARSAVHAYRSELAAWMRNRRAESQSPPPDSLLEAAPGVAGAPNGALRRPLVLGFSAAVLVSLGIWAAAHVVGLASRRGPAPVQLEYRGDHLVAIDTDGAVLWSHAMPVSPDRVTTGINPAKLVQLVDVTGDGEPEVLAVARHPEESSPEPDELVCLSARGETLWSFRFDESMTFGSRTFSGAWSIAAFTVGGAPGPRYVWVAVRQLWWPSVVLKLDVHGREVARFVQSGHVFCLGYLRTRAGDFVLVGGVNNEQDAGALAILNAESPSGSSPQTAGSEFACQGCPAGRPLKYFVFPRTELNRATSSDFNRVTGIRILKDGFEVEVLEAYAPPGSGGAALFEFSETLELRAARFGNSHYDLHRFLTKQGQVGHAPEACPETAPRVLEWVRGEVNAAGSYRSLPAGR